MKRRLSVLALVCLALVFAFPASAQQYKYQTSIPPGIAPPDKLDPRDVDQVHALQDAIKISQKAR